MSGARVLRAQRASAWAARRPEPFGLPLTDGERRAVLAAAVEEGRRQGHAEALAAAEAERSRSRDQLDTALSALATAASALRAAEAEAAALAADGLCRLSLELTSAILGRELAASAHPGLDALRRALGAAPAGRPVLARLAPADLSDLLEVARGHSDPGRSGEAQALVEGVEVRADPSLARGDCVVEVGDQLIDARLGPALDRIADAMGVPTAPAVNRGSSS